ncbi:MAG: hypothetical protein AB2593_13665 [Candidatus Thiodiazotropha sp.]|nr:hypothetical protein [Candidatus Thiodiazotropha taylori]MBT3059778.1 hypothetical protein [Candidatus Thiodiazotropha sp. (ex Lucina pensylvanica)]MBV2095530.1 hypothetical protein [Candidatus Thiodiazotropha sp. (ex Codakia orbicularis)]PUB73028.1 MAG: hypothetical protein DBP03_14540 [gamma proteobacterium symbiont of Ctena orbiculata]MBT3062987.1 hypothetical protein [Candidatus Thiodiazotropha sp. (ex Lucina pensylvanica)]
MNDEIPQNGSLSIIDGVERIFYDGYWIKRYHAPVDSLTDKKRLIQSLTRRLFNHMEHGINIPGRLLDEVRADYRAETDPGKKRVRGAMLAGALFNRAADIFNQLVELEACGVQIKPDNDLMRTCGQCLQEALELGKLVRHRNGSAGIDELWGEPFKAFVMSIEDFYQSRYVKIAMTMRNIDEVAGHMVGCVRSNQGPEALEALIKHYACMARRKCEILRTDPDIFDAWVEFVVAGEAITGYTAAQAEAEAGKGILDEFDSRYMLERGVELIADITRARTSMPSSTEEYLGLCEQFKRRKV